MFAIVRAMKVAAAVLAAATIVSAAASESHARTRSAPTQIGSVRVAVTNAGAFVGVGGGSGTLSFRGRSYPLRVSGIGIGTVGIATADLVGLAYNLRSAADIAGSYTAVGGSVAVFGGAKKVQLQNANGVVLELRGLQGGFEFSMSLSNVTMTLM